MSCAALGADAVIVNDDGEERESSPAQGAEEEHGDVIVIGDSPSRSLSSLPPKDLFPDGVYKITGGR